MNFFIICLIPPLSAVIGWITNYIAVKMIFRPRKPVYLLGVKFWGLIPKRKSDLAEKIGETVEHELISHQDIHQAVNSPTFHEEILTSILDAIDRFIEQKLGTNPIIAIMLSGEAAMQIRKLIKNELRSILPDFMENIFEKVEGRLNFKEIVRNKIEQFDILKLEHIVYNIAAKELRSIEIFGAILGFVIGLVQVAIVLAANGTFF